MVSLLIYVTYNATIKKTKIYILLELLIRIELQHLLENTQYYVRQHYMENIAL
nr:MAG TPA: hypothetical protein [Caudoviricetes sp.]